MIATKRGVQRKHLIKRIDTLEYVEAQLLTKVRNLELLIEYYVEMNNDVEDFEIFLEKKAIDAESSESKSK